MTDSPRVGGVRERAREAMMGELLVVARSQLVHDGVAGLSLRSIARELGIASSAIYRYIGSRDELLTLLIVEGYDQVGDVVEQAASASRKAGDDAGTRWYAMATAFRRWALTNRELFELIYGTPVRGYSAPVDTVQPATRLWTAVARVLWDAAEDGTLHPVAPPAPVDNAMAGGVLDVAREVTGNNNASPEIVELAARSVTLLAALVGMVSAELFGHLVGVARDTDQLFAITMQTAAAGIGLRLELPQPPSAK